VNGPRFDAAFRAQLDLLFQWRRDVRRFQPDPLPDGLLERLLAAANGAPSVGLSQPWRFVTVADPGRRAAIRGNFLSSNAAALAALPDEQAGLYARLKLAGLDEAPVHLAVCVDPAPAQGHGLGRTTQPETTAYSAVLAIHTMWLAARAEGVGLGWVSILDPAAALRALDVPEAWRLVAYLCLGRPLQDSTRPELEQEGWSERQPVALLRR
jgi:5,6-dimethylbenzimidazole synthase